MTNINKAYEDLITAVEKINRINYNINTDYKCGYLEINEKFPVYAKARLSPLVTFSFKDDFHKKTKNIEALISEGILKGELEIECNSEAILESILFSKKTAKYLAGLKVGAAKEIVGLLEEYTDSTQIEGDMLSTPNLAKEYTRIKKWQKKK